MPLSPVSLPYVINNLTSGPEPGTILDANFNALLGAINNPLSYVNYAPDTGTANSLVAIFNPPVTQLAAGLTLTVKVLNGNTGATTLNANTTGAKSIVNEDASSLRSGQLTAGLIILVVYDGTNYVLVSYANYITKVGNYAFPDVAAARTLNTMGYDATYSYVNGTGVAGTNNAVQAILQVLVPANSLNGVGRSLRCLWKVLITGANNIQISIDLNGNILAQLANAGTGTFMSGEFWVYYLDSTHASGGGYQIAFDNSIAGYGQYQNAAGFAWTAAQNITLTQSAAVGTKLTALQCVVVYS